jgi:hypothetical protein
MQITVQKIFQPFKADDASGCFIGTDGAKYYLGIATHRTLTEGMTLNVEGVEKRTSKQGKAYFIIQGAVTPVNNPIPDTPTPPRSNGNGYAPRDDDYICRQAILKSLIEAGMLSNGLDMDYLVQLAWQTAPKLRTRPEYAPTMAGHKPANDELDEKIPF